MGGLGGFNIWDLINRPKTNNPYLDPQTPPEQQASAADPSLDEVPDYSSLLDEPPPDEQPIIQAPKIIGSEAPETKDILAQYKDWMSRRPKEEDYKPSTGRMILAGLAGFLSRNPGVANDIAYGKYKGAEREWQDEGKALGDVGEFAQKVSVERGKKEGDILQYTSSEDRTKATLQGISERSKAEDTRHRDRMATLTNEQAKAAEVKRHNAEQEKLAKERNAIDKTEAGARVTAANAYAQSVTNAKNKPPKPPNYQALRTATMDAVREGLSRYPDYEKFFTRDPKNKGAIYLKKNLDIPPVDQMRLQQFLKDMEKNARDKLATTSTDVEDYQSLRPEIE